MGTKIKILTVSALFLMLCGCTKVITVPYTYVSEGVYACGDKVWENNVIRDKTSVDRQALQFIQDDRGVNLIPGELADYSGSLYSLSNYRALLLGEGFAVERETRTCDILDTTLSKDGDRVRLIYQSSGSIRILFENRQGAAHILLEGIQ